MKKSGGRGDQHIGVRPGVVNEADHLGCDVGRRSYEGGADAVSVDRLAQVEPRRLPSKLGADELGESRRRLRSQTNRCGDGERDCHAVGHRITERRLHVCDETQCDLVEPQLRLRRAAARSDPPRELFVGGVRRRRHVCAERISVLKFIQDVATFMVLLHQGTPQGHRTIHE